ncbi:MAG: TonB family protein [Desulfobacterales bacterium]|nr:TonB family protein [Desulfobacterales bacterium]
MVAGTLKQENNRLLTGFILVSMIAHVLLFLHLSGIYESHAISYIELTMENISRPNARRLPTPRSRRIPDDPKPRTVANTHRPPAPVHIPAPDLPDPLAEQIPLPALPDQMDMGSYHVAGLPSVGAAAPDMGEIRQFSSAREYFELLNLRINQMKSYPEDARSRHIQGRVKVQFTLAPNGTISMLTLARKSRHDMLNQAALEAVKKAVPFPVPPAHILKTPMTLRVSILFELT